MRLPQSLVSLCDQGIIERVLRPLMSGKEAEVYLVVANGEERVAKVYKDAQQRTFKQKAEYTEGRTVRSSRDRRAIGKRTRYGREQDEAAWRTAEVDVIYRLRAAGVRVPEPLNFIDGVLIMEMIVDADGEPAPRLAEVDFSREEAQVVFDHLLREVVRMLCAGVVHGDLSDFNVLQGAAGPVIIDFPQAVDPARNQNARKLLLRDVENLKRFLGRFVPTLRRMPYGEEMWDAYQRNQLTPETALRGRYSPSSHVTDMSSLLDEIETAERDEGRRREALGMAPIRPRKREVIISPPAGAPRRGGGDGRRDDRGGRAGQGNPRGPNGGARAGRGADGRPRDGGPGERRGADARGRDGAPGRGPGERRGPDGSERARAPAAGPSRRGPGPGNGNGAPERHGDPADPQAPRKRRRRRRRKPGSGDGPEARPSGGARPGDSSDPGPPRRQDGPRPQVKGDAPPRPAEGPRAEGEGAAAKPRRRRRRRRRAEGSPGSAPPVAPGA